MGKVVPSYISELQLVKDHVNIIENLAQAKTAWPKREVWCRIYAFGTSAPLCLDAVILHVTKLAVSAFRYVENAMSKESSEKRATLDLKSEVKCQAYKVALFVGLFFVSPFVGLVSPQFYLEKGRALSVIGPVEQCVTQQAEKKKQGEQKESREAPPQTGTNQAASQSAKASKTASSNSPSAVDQKAKSKKKNFLLRRKKQGTEKSSSSTPKKAKAAKSAKQSKVNSKSSKEADSKKAKKLSSKQEKTEDREGKSTKKSLRSFFHRSTPKKNAASTSKKG